MIIDGLDRIDKTLFNLFNSELTNPLLDWFMPIITNQNYWAVPLFLSWLCLIAFGGKQGRITAAILILAMAFTDYSITEFLKPVFGRLRPYWEMPDGVNLLVKKGGKYGFVSAHAANSISGAVVLSYFYSRYRGLFFSLAILLGFSRIYVGVHYPGDVIFGALYGYGIAWAVLSLWVIIKMRELKRGKTWVIYKSK